MLASAKIWRPLPGQKTTRLIRLHFPKSRASNTVERKCMQSLKMVLVSIEVSEGDVVKVDYRAGDMGARVEFGRVLLFAERRRHAHRPASGRGYAYSGRSGGSSLDEAVHSALPPSQELSPSARPSPAVHQCAHPPYPPARPATARRSAAATSAGQQRNSGRSGSREHASNTVNEWGMGSGEKKSLPTPHSHGFRLIDFDPALYNITRYDDRTTRQEGGAPIDRAPVGKEA